MNERACRFLSCERVWAHSANINVPEDIEYHIKSHPDKNYKRCVGELRRAPIFQLIKMIDYHLTD